MRVRAGCRLGQAGGLLAKTTEALRSGLQGQVDDISAVARPWGCRFSQIRVPTTVWWGAEDTEIPETMARRTAAEIPGAHLVVPGVGHLLYPHRWQDVLTTLTAPAPHYCASTRLLRVCSPPSAGCRARTGGTTMIERTEGYLKVGDGEKIWYESAGHGPVVVFSHGLGGNAAAWYQQVPHFATRYRVVTWDQRGFGRSSNNGLRHGPRAAVADLLAVLDHLQVDRAAIVGQSMGGWSAMGAALQDPGRVAAVVLACTTGGIPPVKVAAMDPALVGGPAGVRPLGVHPAIGDRLPAIDPAKAYLYQALGTFGHRPPDSEFARLLHESSYDPAELSGMTQPVLLLCGELDTLMTPTLVRDAAIRLPRATVVEMAGRGHSPYFEDPHAWNEIVDGFLTREYPAG